MRCAVRADNARAVHAQDNVQTFDCNIVNNLVVSALQESRVNGRYRHQSLCRHTGRHTDGVLLGDADIEKAFREVSPQSESVPCRTA